MSIPDPLLGVDLLMLMGSREEVEAGDHLKTLASLTTFLREDKCRQFRQRVMFGITGYDEDPRELFEIPEVRRWVIELDVKWPYWFFFLWPGQRSTLPLIAFCLCPFTVLPQGGKLIEPEALAAFQTRAFVAMNGICEWLGDSDEVNIEMSDRITALFQGGEATSGGAA